MATATIDVIVADLQTFADKRGLAMDVARAFSDLADDEPGECWRYDEARERMWAAVLELSATQGTFTNRDLEWCADVGKSTASLWAKRFVQEGLLKVVTRRVGKDATRYKVKGADNGD